MMVSLYLSPIMILSKYLSRDFMKILTANSYKSVLATIPSYSNCSYIKITYGNLMEQKRKGNNLHFYILSKKRYQCIVQKVSVLC